jgi:hypothetical protein
MNYRITNQKQLREQFWAEHPELSRKKIKDYAGTGKMYNTDTRTAFVNWLDALQKNGDVSQELAERATLS